jgi:hypothetical protein
MRADGARPWWFWALMTLAAVKVALGSAGLLLPAGTTGPPSPFPGWVYLITMAVYVTVAGTLLLGGRRDSRAILLGGAFALTASMSADRGLVRVAAQAPALLAHPSAILASLDPGAFRPLLVWMFACAFPRDALAGTWRKVARTGLIVCAIVGIAIFAVSVWSASDVMRRTLTIPENVRWLLPNDLSDRSYPLVTPLTLAGLALVLVNMRAAGRSDYRRAQVFVAGLLLGTAPILAEAAAELFIPPYGRFMSQPTPRFWSGVVFYPLLYGGLLVAAYAVYSSQVLSVRLVVRRAVRYAFARATLIALIFVPFAILAWIVFEERNAPLNELLGGPRQLALVALVAVATLLLRVRRPLLTALDRRFFREQYDSRQILASLIDSGRSAPSVEVLAEHVTSEIDRALHVTRATLFLLDATGAGLHPVGASGEPLPVTATLATLVAGGDAPMDVGPSSAGGTLARLPSAERDWLAKGDFRLLVPVSDGRGGLAGLIAIGEKRSELPFSREDLWLLSHTASSAGLAIGRLRPLTPSPAPANGAEPAPPPHLDPARECARCGRVHAPGLITCTACGGSLHDAPVPLYVHGLQVERRIGTGGMGVVYEATDLALRRQVAVKTLPAVSMGHARQLRQEARAMAALSHPNLATIYALDLWRGTPLLLVEYLHGGTLQQALREGSLPIARVLDIGIVLAGALAHMHGQSILHRDIKPSNIGFSSTGVPKMLDFGLAKMIVTAVGTREGEPTTTATTEGLRSDSAALLIGTPAYFSPELASLHPADFHSDLWAMALTLYEAIAGANPFAGATHLETLERIATLTLPPLDTVREDCPQAVAECLGRALSREKGDRPSTATILQDALRTARSAI